MDIGRKMKSRFKIIPKEKQEQRYQQILQYRKAHQKQINLARALCEYMRYHNIKRPIQCSKCLKEGYIVGHHFNYDDKFNVIWLCMSCHKRLHRDIEGSKPLIQMKARYKMNYRKQVKIGDIVKFNNWNKENGYYSCYGEVKEDDGAYWYIKITPSHHAKILKIHCERHIECNGDWILRQLNKIEQ